MRRGELSILWRQQTGLRDLRHFSLLQDERYNEIGLIATIEELHACMRTSSPRIYLTPHETRMLNLGLVAIIEGGRGHLPFITSSLNLDQVYDSHNGIIQTLNERMSEDLASPSALTIRCLLSAMLEGLNDDENWVEIPKRELIMSSLKPLMFHRDAQQLFERHSRWL